MSGGTSAESNLTECDHEPIHIPGAIQPHGVLLALQPDSLTVVQVAGDTPALLGVTPEDLLGHSLRAQLGGAALAKLEILLRRTETGPRPFFIFKVQSPVAMLDVCAHISAGVLVLELERCAPPERADPMEEVQRMTECLRDAESVDGLLGFMASEVQRVTGFDRVMIYRFDTTGSGHVVAEHRSGPQVDSFLGLHYPASDIPRQARKLYLSNWIRCIPDSNYVPMPISPPDNPVTGQPLDLTYSALRSVSPIHLEYLANMGVAASMSLSIVVGGELWGLIACHHYQAHFLDSGLRAGLELFAQVSSLQLAARLDIERARQDSMRRQLQDELLAAINTGGFPGGFGLNPGLLTQLVSAAGVVVHVNGETYSYGSVPDADTLHWVISWLNGKPAQSVWATDRLSEQLNSPVDLTGAAGLLALSISRHPRDYILWFLPELPTTVSWAGDPEKPARHGGERLTPRKSFAAWIETVTGRSREWRADEIAAAQRLRVALLEHTLLHLDEIARERAQTAARQELVMRELDHRVKNILATIQALVRFSGKNAGSLEDFTKGLERRLASMARAHDLLTDSRWISASLHRLLNEELSPYRLDGGANLRITGEDVALIPSAASSLSLLIHELATNAAKYGCYSVPEGVLNVTIGRVDDGRSTPRIVIDWLECNGPVVTKPSRSGFGRVLLEKVFEHDASGGSVSLDFHPAGVRCRIEIPVERTIPSLQSTVPVKSPLAEQHLDTPSLTGIQVLVVEDNPLVSLGIVETITAAGAELIGPFGTLDQSIAVATEGMFDVALLDVDLGGVAVWPVARIIHERNIPIVLLTGFSDATARPEEFKDVPILRKPYDSHRLISKLHRLTTAPAGA